LDVFIAYLKKKSPVYPAVEWRITFLKEGEDNTGGGSAGLKAFSLAVTMLFALISLFK
jgi:hypothetical protein